MARLEILLMRGLGLALAAVGSTIATALGGDVLREAGQALGSLGDTLAKAAEAVSRAVNAFVDGVVNFFKDLRGDPRRERAHR